eukprot:TRINITY_DN7513_c0_g1_i11.p1 TRINITY_DN7513_c0_g1~~TRINITY_DN7513_c0_g1_i11.p1  ORF type:complete len:437 (+),score=65.83 TRINITY_DN7513_c0_g1_i11:1053-2363(+)
MFLTIVSLIAIGIFLQWLFQRYNNPKLPPEPFHWFWIGNMVRYGLDPVAFMSKMCKAYGGVFTLNLAGRQIVVVGDRGALSQVYRSNDSILSSIESIKDFGFLETTGSVSINHGTSLHKSVINNHVKKNMTEYMKGFARITQRVISELPVNKNIDLFETMRTITGHVLMSEFIEPEALVSLPNFIQDFHVFEEKSEDVVGKTLVLRKTLTYPILKKVESMRVDLENQLHQVVLKAYKSDQLTPYARDILRLIREDEVSKITGKDESRILSEVLFGILAAAHKNMAIGSAQALIFLEEHSIYEKQIKREVETLFSMEDGEVDDNDSRRLDKIASILSSGETLPHLQNIVSETLRVTAHNINSIRKVVVDDFKLEVGDDYYTIPKGYYIAIPAQFLSLDGEVFNQPKQFNPDRYSLGQPRTKWPQVPFRYATLDWFYY